MPTFVTMRPEDQKSLHLLWAPQYLHGFCYLFAEALHQGLGWPMLGIEGPGGTIPHAAVQCPDGRLFDARGYVTHEEFGRPFGFNLPDGLSAGKIMRLRQVTGTELAAFDEIPAEARERGIAQARVMAEMVWPDLPWLASIFAPASDFAAELEALCRKHGVWVCGQNLWLAPEAEGNCTYELTPMLNNMLSLKRVFVDAP